MDAVGSRFVDILSPIKEEFDSTPPETAYRPNGARVPMEGAHNDLAHIRALFPFMPILGIPDDIVSVVCTNNNQSYDMPIPDGTVLLHFRADGSAQDWFVNFESRVISPSTAGANDPNSDSGRNQALIAPDYQWWYVGKTGHVSVGSTSAGRIIQAACIIAKVRP